MNNTPRIDREAINDYWNQTTTYPQRFAIIIMVKNKHETNARNLEKLCKELLWELNHADIISWWNEKQKELPEELRRYIDTGTDELQGVEKEATQEYIKSDMPDTDMSIGEVWTQRKIEIIRKWNKTQSVLPESWQRLIELPVEALQAESYFRALSIVERLNMYKVATGRYYADHTAKNDAYEVERYIIKNCLS